MTDNRVLHMERLIPAPPDRVFRAFTETTDFAAWWGPEGVTIPEADIDLRPGGKWRTVLRTPDGALNIVGGVYRKIEAPSQLVFTWAWDQDAQGTKGHETVVTLRFAAVPGGTKLTLEQATFADSEQRAKHQNGWGLSFDCLVKHVQARSAA